MQVVGARKDLIKDQKQYTPRLDFFNSHLKKLR